MTSFTQTNRRSFEVHKVLRNAFMGVGIELMAYVFGMYLSVQLGVTAFFIPFIIAMVLIFIIPKFANSWIGFGLANLMTFALGFSAAPAMMYYLNGGFITEVYMSAAATVVVTFGLSAYVQLTKKDFGFLGGMLFVGLLALIVLSLLNIFLFKSSIFALAGSYVGVLIFSGYILYDVSNIVLNKQSNWIMASVSMFLNMINLFWSLLHILTATRD